MKLLFCTSCNDLRYIHRTPTTCICGCSTARYYNDIWVIYDGPCIILGMLNWEIILVRKAAISTTLTGQDQLTGQWFTIPEGNHVRRVTPCPEPSLHCSICPNEGLCQHGIDLALLQST